MRPPEATWGDKRHGHRARGRPHRRHIALVDALAHNAGGGDRRCDGTTPSLQRHATHARAWDQHPRRAVKSSRAVACRAARSSAAIAHRRGPATYRLSAPAVLR